MDKIKTLLSINLDSLVIAKKIGLTEQDIEKIIEDGIQEKLKIHQEKIKEEIASSIEEMNKLPHFHMND